jgi:hypothetical protein
MAAMAGWRGALQNAFHQLLQCNVSGALCGATRCRSVAGKAQQMASVVHEFVHICATNERGPRPARPRRNRLPAKARVRRKRPTEATLAAHRYARRDADAPHRDLLLNPHDFDGLVGQDRQRMVQTRRIDPNPVVADRFEHEHDFLARGKHAIEVVLESTLETWTIAGAAAIKPR